MDLNETPCEKCAEHDRECRQWLDGALGCQQCFTSKLGCSIINQLGKSKALKSLRKAKLSKKGKEVSREDSVQLLGPEEIVVVGEMPRMMVELVEQSMALFAEMLAKSKLAREEVAGMRGEMKRMADAIEGLAGLLREKWSGGSVGKSAAVAEVEKEGTEGKTLVSVPEDLGSEEEDDDEKSEDEEVEDEEDEDEDEEDEDEDVEMDDDEPRAFNARPIGIIGNPIIRASSSAS